MRFITATQLFNGSEFLPEHSVIVLDDDNKLKEIVMMQSVPADKLEVYEGIITPGFINAHCHLELSHLHKQIRQNTGFTGFAIELMSKRFSYSQELIQEAMWIAEEQMWENGIVAVGDISNSADSFEIKAKSDLYFHTFIELIALNPSLAEKVMAAGKETLSKIKRDKATLSPHAPYSVSFELMQAISKACSIGLPLTIHNQESAAENEFFEKGTGRVLDLYKHLNIDISYYTPHDKSSLQSYLTNLPADKNVILVHNTFTNNDDVVYAENYSKNLYWCLCPNANLYIENNFPDIKNLVKNNRKIVIGTDSLASNHQLSVISELNILLNNFKEITPAQTLTWATSNGAKALGIEDRYGSYLATQKPGLNLISLENNEFVFLKKLG